MQTHDNSSDLNKSNGRPRLAWVALTVVVWGIVLLIFLPPYVGVGLRAILMSAFRPLCHQIPARSPSLAGVQLAVCHRCLGIYVGLAVAATASVALLRFSSRIDRSARFVLPLSLLPLAIDWLADFIGLWSNTPATRMATGAIFGLVGGLFLARAVVQLANRPGKAPAISE